MSNKALIFIYFLPRCRSELSLRAGKEAGGHLFGVARDDAEKQICEKLKYKLDEFLELESYDWLLVEPQGHASSFITDLIAFLNSTFTSFTDLPVCIISVLCFLTYS